MRNVADVGEVGGFADEALGDKKAGGEFAVIAGVRMTTARFWPSTRISSGTSAARKSRSRRADGAVDPLHGDFFEPDFGQHDAFREQGNARGAGLSPAGNGGRGPSLKFQISSFKFQAGDGDRAGDFNTKARSLSAKPQGEVRELEIYFSRKPVRDLRSPSSPTN